MKDALERCILISQGIFCERTYDKFADVISDYLHECNKMYLIDEMVVFVMVKAIFI